MSYITGDPKYEQKAMVFFQRLSERRFSNGLVPIYVNPASGTITGSQVRRQPTTFVLVLDESPTVRAVLISLVELVLEDSLGVLWYLCCVALVRWVRRDSSPQQESHRYIGCRSLVSTFLGALSYSGRLCCFQGVCPPTRFARILMFCVCCTWACTGDVWSSGRLVL